MGSRRLWEIPGRLRYYDSGQMTLMGRVLGVSWAQVYAPLRFYQLEQVQSVVNLVRLGDAQGASRNGSISRQIQQILLAGLPQVAFS